MLKESEEGILGLRDLYGTTAHNYLVFRHRHFSPSTLACRAEAQSETEP